MELGAQLYTVREFCKTLDDFAETLKKIADIGYKTVQVSATCAFEPEWLKARLTENGLRCVATHAPVLKMLEDPHQVAKNHKTFGCDNIGIGMYKIKEIGIDAFYEKFLPTASAFHDEGCRLVYHNHDLEFDKISDRLIIDQVAEKFSPELLSFILDTFWVQAAGGDPAQWIYRLRDRIACIHLKDMGYGRTMLPVGSGNMNMEAILHAAEDTGVKYALVEQDQCGDENPFDCLRKSYEFLHAAGLQ